MQFALSLDGSPLLPVLRDRLLAVYGPQRGDATGDPLDLFVYAMIASQTRDAISMAAFRALQRHFPSWRQVNDADPREIERAIAPVTWAREKSVDLKRALSMIAARYGLLDLSFLADQTVHSAMQCLTSLHGVRAKIAAVTLNFSVLRKRALVVDMHLLRIGKRLGWLPESANSDIGFDRYMRLVPDDWTGDDLYELHWLIKLHSQRICTFAEPDCARCVLRDLCASSRLDVMPVDGGRVVGESQL